MAITTESLSSLVFADLLSNFPEASASLRSNETTGVLEHSPPTSFIDALTEAVVTSALQMAINDLGSGTLPSGGTAVPVPFTFPTASAGASELIASLGLLGQDGATWADIAIVSVLSNLASIGLLTMPTNPGVGAGTGIVSAASNPSLKSTMETSLNTTLVTAFGATGHFCVEDNPVAFPNTVNETLAAQLPFYASALATGFAGITATVVYASAATPGGAVSGITNTGYIS